jgi:hypothetical protein
MIVLEKVNEVYLRIHCDISTAIELKEYLSVYANNFKFNPRFKARIWNGKISFFDMRTRLLPFGLLPKFIKFCSIYKYEYKFDFLKSDLYNTISREIIEDFSNGLVSDYGITPYDYQIETVKASIENKRGIILSPTGSGKSLSIYLTTRLLLTQNQDRKILLVVPTVSLVEQMYNDFSSYGWEDLEEYVEKLYSGLDPDFEKNVLITTWQSIVNKHQNFFLKYEALLVDECLDGETLIDTPDGKKLIKNMKKNDKIFSYNEKTKKREIDTVKRVFENMFISSNEDMYEIEMEDCSILKITGNHKVFTKRGWVQVKELNNDDDILNHVEL